MSQVLVKSKLKLPTESFQEQETKLSDIIRGFKFPQLRRMLADGKGSYCVMGGLLKVFGEPEGTHGMHPSHFGIPTTKIYNMMHGNNIGLAGMDVWFVCVRMNNSGYTFAEIADYLESIGL